MQQLTVHSIFCACITPNKNNQFLSSRHCYLLLLPVQLITEIDVRRYLAIDESFTQVRTKDTRKTCANCEVRTAKCLVAIFPYLDYNITARLLFLTVSPRWSEKLAPVSSSYLHERPIGIDH